MKHLRKLNLPTCMSNLRYFMSKSLTHNIHFASCYFGVPLRFSLRKILWTLHQVGSSPNARNFKQRKSRDKPDLFLCNKKLLEPCQNRTICIELYKVIKSTNSNLFRQIQGYNDDRINKLYAS